MKKNILYINLILSFLYLSSTAMAQNQNTNSDILYLKNGSILRGSIERFSAQGDTIYFRNRNGTDMKILEIMVKKMVQYEQGNPTIAKPYEFREQGLWGALTANMMLGRTTTENTPTLGTGLTGVIGWRQNRWQNWGIGASYDQYYLGNGNSSMLGIFAEWRGILRASQNSEVFTLSGGWGFPLNGVENTDWGNTNNKNVSGGLYFHPSIGWRLGASGRYNFMFDVGVRFQNATFRTQNTWISRDYHVWYRRSVIRLGILF